MATLTVIGKLVDITSIRARSKLGARLLKGRYKANSDVPRKGFNLLIGYYHRPVTTRAFFWG